MSSVKVIKVNFEWLDISVLPAFRFFLIFFFIYFFVAWSQMLKDFQKTGVIQHYPFDWKRKYKWIE